MSKHWIAAIHHSEYCAKPHKDLCIHGFYWGCDRCYADALVGRVPAFYATTLYPKVLMFSAPCESLPKIPAKTPRDILLEQEEIDRLAQNLIDLAKTPAAAPVAYRFRETVQTTRFPGTTCSTTTAKTPPVINEPPLPAASEMTYGHIKRLIESHRDLLYTLAYVRHRLANGYTDFNLDRINKVIASAENATK